MTDRRDAPAPAAGVVRDDRRPTLLGVSLKLYMTPQRSAEWAATVADVASRHPGIREGAVELFVLPSLPALTEVRRALAGTGVGVGAQDLFWEDRGAYTGGVSGADLAAIGCRYVEVGHAERRRWFGEDDLTVHRKLAAAFRNGLIPVLCVGERERGAARDAVQECVDQLESALFGIPPRPDVPLVIAYEPEWAIGADASASPEHVDAVCRGLRAALEGHAWLSAVRVIYGGSAQPGLLPRLGPDVDGLFLGRFAHDPAALDLILDEAVAVR